ncbi:hypothetical protein MLPF_0105 [Mycobacterium lepromatosis]|nr:hypothetical protein MLPF_0105 [Mycobacterium lepromatosis]
MTVLPGCWNAGGVNHLPVNLESRCRTQPQLWKTARVPVFWHAALNVPADREGEQEQDLPGSRSSLTTIIGQVGGRLMPGRSPQNRSGRSSRCGSMRQPSDAVDGVLMAALAGFGVAGGVAGLRYLVLSQLNGTA